ncbi:hypothetical protein CTA2_9341 [Colletotrichum tanaceti]|nr:hypothetical protein CTA2_9341 [Colletotrichum tanaceti]
MIIAPTWAHGLTYTIGIKMDRSRQYQYQYRSQWPQAFHIVQPLSETSQQESHLRLSIRTYGYVGTLTVYVYSNPPPARPKPPQTQLNSSLQPGDFDTLTPGTTWIWTWVARTHSRPLPTFFQAPPQPTAQSPTTNNNHIRQPLLQPPPLPPPAPTYLRP